MDSPGSASLLEDSVAVLVRLAPGSLAVRCQLRVISSACFGEGSCLVGTVVKKLFLLKVGFVKHLLKRPQFPREFVFGPRARDLCCLCCALVLLFKTQLMFICLVIFGKFIPGIFIAFLSVSIMLCL